MYQKSDIPQKWTINAEVTITHPNSSTNDAGSVRYNPGVARTEHLDRGVRMTYSWHSSTTPPSSAPTNASTTGVNKNSLVGSYGFQRGNMIFTSSPPQRRVQNDSGYHSDLFSSSSTSKYDRKCQSTCSIVLSTDFNEGTKINVTPGDFYSAPTCSRTQSLRCQQPSRPNRNRIAGYYGCGDPWCYHSNAVYPDSSRFSPVPESCEEWSATTADSSTNKTSPSSILTNRRPKVQDAASQTLQTKDQCTSPMFKSPLFTPQFHNYNNLSKIGSSSLSNSKLNRKKYGTRHKTEPLPRRFYKQEFSDDSKPRNDNNLNENDQKPRTVHIDVYCTGSDIDSDSSSSSDSDDKEITVASTPQTVYENEALRIRHKRIDEKQLLPNKLQRSRPESNLSSFASSTMLSKRSSVVSDDGDFSSLYPSQKSSLQDSSTSILPQSWSSATMSTSSCTLPDYESVSTSWKDTISDYDTILPKMNRIPSASSATGSANLLVTDTSASSLLPSDSFEYADASDRQRIKKMEELWTKNQRLSTDQVKYTLQQQKINEYIERCLAKKTVPKSQDDIKTEESKSASSANESEMDWTSSLKRGDTIRHVSKDDTINQIKSNLIFNGKQNSTNDLLLRAQLFGTILNGSGRRFGRHMGPVRNPVCTCEHCTSYYSNRRNRTRSVGDAPDGRFNWKQELSQRDKIRLESKNPNYTDF